MDQIRLEVEHVLQADAVEILGARLLFLVGAWTPRNVRFLTLSHWEPHATRYRLPG